MGSSSQDDSALVKTIDANAISVGDLRTCRILLVKNALDPLLFDDRVAAPARALCRELFGSGARRTAPEEWVVNFDTRSLVPHAPSGDPPDRPSVSEFLVNTRLGRLLREVAGQSSYPDGGRLRYQPADHTNHPLHQDCMFHNVERFFTLWIPAVQKGETVNREVPGLRLFTPRVERCLKQACTSLPTVCQEDLERCAGPVDGIDPYIEPEMVLGDVLMFRETVPHGSHIPATARGARVSFDLRWPLVTEQ